MGNDGKVANVFLHIFNTLIETSLL